MGWLKHPVVHFLAAALVAYVVVVLLTGQRSKDAAEDEAIRDAIDRTRLLGAYVAEPAIPLRFVAGDVGAMDRFKRALDPLIKKDDRPADEAGVVTTVKVWNEQGKVLYSNEDRLIGRTFALGEDELEVLRGVGEDGDDTRAEISLQNQPENQFEQQDVGLVEVYTQIWSPEGQPLLFEVYYSSDDIENEREAIFGRFRPITLSGLGIFVLVTTPLVLLLTRRLTRASQERERLLQTAVHASDAERLRIARDLHDGVVQDLAGTSFALSTLSSRPGVAPALAEEMEEVSRTLRSSMRALRSLLVEIYPPDLHTEGLAAALNDLLSPVTASGRHATLEVSGAEDVSEPATALVWRVAQEAVRNAVRHANASRLGVTVQRKSDLLTLDVSDDGTGFDSTAPTPQTHFGLRGLESLAREAGATLTIDSSPGSGTTVHLEVPAQ